MMKTLNAIEKEAFEHLQNALNVCGDAELIGNLIGQNCAYLFTVSDIRNGCGKSERDPNETPAQVLEELRETHEPDLGDINERMFTIRTVAEVIAAARKVVNLYKAAQR